MEQKIIDLKNALHFGMIANYNHDGKLVPMIFYLKGNAPHFRQIPSRLLRYEAKEELAKMIREICSEPDVCAAGIIREAWGTTISLNSELGKAILNGDTRIEDLEDKIELISLLFSTPEGEELISYKVDGKTKTVKGRYEDPKSSERIVGGMFKNLFIWNKRKN